MKTILFYIALLSSISIYAQTQIGADIDGEAASDYSGFVSLSSDGSTIAIGASSNDGNGMTSGHVRVYRNTSGAWAQIGTDIDGEVAFAGLMTVSLSYDGTTLAVGARGSDTSIGYVSIYENISDVWTQIGTNIDGEAEGQNSVRIVSLSSDGNTLAIGVPGHWLDVGSIGVVRIYENIAGVWTQIGNDIVDEAEDDESGGSISLSSDGYTIAIGAAKNDGNGTDSGHVRVYQNLAGVWIQIGDDIDGEVEGDFSGISVSLSADGSVVAIGAPSNDENGADSGHVRVYENMAGVWVQVGSDINGEAEGDFAADVSLASDGTTLAIGAAGNDGNGPDSGSVRIYKNNSGVWTQLGTDIDGEAEDDRAADVSLSSDGTTLAIGAPYNDGVNGGHSGHVRVYDLSALLSIENNEIAKNFTLYPNPVTNQLQLQLSPTLEFKMATIYNYYGQLVLQSNTTTINVSSLASSVYFIEVETNKGKGVKRIIKK